MQLTVLICTHNRSYGILDCLKSVEQSLRYAAPVDAEILVIDNASTDDTSATVKQWAATCSVPVNLVFEAKKGLATARNCGLRHARGDLIVFTDDDCRLSETYIADTLRHDAADGAELVMRGGRVELEDPTDLPITIKTDTEARVWQKSLRSARYTNMGDCLPGCNMVMRQSLIKKIGIFDERFGAGTNIPDGEDTDYLYRVYIAGFKIAYVPDMLMWHHHGRKTPADGNKLMGNYCIGTGALFTKYLFKEIDFMRPLYWDLKKFVREVCGSENFFMPSINFTTIDKIYYYTIGAFRFLYRTAFG